MVENRRRLKNLFYKWKLHRVFGWIANKFHLFVYLTKVSKWISNHRELPFNDFYSAKRDYSKRLGLFEFLNKNYLNDHPISYLEFGVAAGKSMKWWTQNLQDPSARFYGFDTFSGLPEDWGHFEKGAMSNEGVLPDIRDERCTFYKGLFQDTLPGFLNSQSVEDSIKVIHLDADLYSATLYVLTTLHPILKKGDILIFDEFNVPLHEFKAFDDYISAYYVEYEVLAATNNYYQVAIRLT